VGLYAGAVNPEKANWTVLVIAMIETRSALEHLEAILAVPGLDVVFVGPADLSQALGGGPGADWTEGLVLPVLERIIRLARVAGVPAGIFCRSAAYAARMVAEGFSFVTLNSDVAYVEAGAAAALARFSSELKGSTAR